MPPAIDISCSRRVFVSQHASRVEAVLPSARPRTMLQCPCTDGAWVCRLMSARAADVPSIGLDQSVGFLYFVYGVHM